MADNVNKKEKGLGLAVVMGVGGILLSLIVAWVLYIFTWQDLGSVMSVIFAAAVFGLGAVLSVGIAFCVSSLEKIGERVRRLEDRE